MNNYRERLLNFSIEKNLIICKTLLRVNHLYTREEPAKKKIKFSDRLCHAEEEGKKTGDGFPCLWRAFIE